ncbi:MULTISPECIES: FAD-binding oxidoreductase [Streptomyces]|uniref:FAD-binding oxidoreductase n=1 Tax=Streptomyces lycopersici TaxID=2974589 RepID=UPI0021D0EA59|nr:FAD-binding protein [Streptomyces sp. NEAU-383]
MSTSNVETTRDRNDNGAGGSGPVTVCPGDSRYAELTVGHNARWVGTPESVRLPRTTEQVERIVQDVVRKNERFSVTSGGHCYADHVYNPSVRTVIDMSLMTDIYYDPRHQAFAVEAGATLLQVYETLFKGWGVGVPGGIFYSVGAGGHVSGGGFGLLSRQFGLTVDHLYAVEVVVVDARGRARTVTATRRKNDPNRELWWAHTGGGGGNFGVVTRYWFRSPDATGRAPEQQLMRPPKDVLLNAVALPWDELDEGRFTTLVRNYGSWYERNSAPDSPYAPLSSLLNLNHRANKSVGLLTQIDATLPGADKLLQSFVEEVTTPVGVGVRPVTESVGEQGPMPEFFHPVRLPYLTSVRYISTNNATLTNPALRGAYKSAYMRKGFTDDQIAALYRRLSDPAWENAASSVILFGYGARVSAVGADETASAQRDSIFKALYSALWREPEDDEANVGWLRGIFGDVHAATGGYPVPNDVTDGCYVNYQDGDITDPEQNRSGVPWHTLYYKHHYPRLQRVKAAYDPRNVFRHPQSIALPED